MTSAPTIPCPACTLAITECRCDVHALRAALRDTKEQLATALHALRVVDAWESARRGVASPVAAELLAPYFERGLFHPGSLFPEVVRPVLRAHPIPESERPKKARPA